jgi:hypothetical protein
MITVLLAAAVAATAAACLLLGATLRELRRLHERDTRPALVVDIESDGAGIPAVTVTNVGHGPALDAELTITFDEHDPVPRTTQRPPQLPQRFHATRVLAPGAQVRFPPPGAPDTGHLAPQALAAWVRTIELSGNATDLDGRPVMIHDRLDDPFRRVATMRATPEPERPRPSIDPHRPVPGRHFRTSSRTR